MAGKIQAFTLGELVVVLIITSIVVGLAFSVLNLVQKHISSIQSNLISNTELDKLEQSLFLDFNRYSNIIYDDTNDKIIFKNSLDSVSYVFHRSCVIKSTDTLRVPLEEKNVFLDGKRTVTGQLDAIKLRTTKSFLDKTIFIFKKNDASHFMN